MQIVFGATLANHNRSQAEVIATTCLFNEDASEQAPDTPEAIKHNVFSAVAGIFFRLGRILTNHRPDFFFQKLDQVTTFFLELYRQLADVNVRAPEIHLIHGLQ